MPIFEYVCEDCRKPFEKIVLNRAATIACPACGSSRYTLQYSVIASPKKESSDEYAGPSCAGPSGACDPSTCGRN